LNIQGKITGIKYKPVFIEELRVFDLSNFDINTAPASCLISNKKNTLAISKWVSPKRTRSYPFERVYNTLNISKKITVIPIIKDEGASGDRDFIQWDTISLMSLLDVFIIFTNYTDAEKLKNKITNQKFDNSYVISKIKEIEQFHSSALHWNLDELQKNLHKIIDKTKKSYEKISLKTGIRLHNHSGIDNFKNRIGKDISLFMNFSREKAKNAQSREYKTIQPKESLSSFSKAKITILNYLGGKYFFTVDEISIHNKKTHLIESKHSKGNLLPSLSDIKDGLFKMILYCNLEDVTVDGIATEYIPVLKLTSGRLSGEITSLSNLEDVDVFFANNNLSSLKKKLIKKVFSEANQNNFFVIIGYSK